MGSTKGIEEVYKYSALMEDEIHIKLSNRSLSFFIAYCELNKNYKYMKVTCLHHHDSERIKTKWWRRVLIRR
jgi:hypothetical protein